MSLGQTLKQAREAKGLTLSQVAEATRMMVQVVEDLEREDFRRVAAPIYGRGFIKLYAEHLGLDSEPLIQEFMEIYTGTRPPQVVRRPAADDGQTGGQSDGGAAGQFEGQAGEQAESPAGAPPDRRTARPPDGPTDSPSDQPDLFSVAAGRSAAVPSVAEPTHPGDATPPRVRPAADAAERKPAPAAPAEPVAPALSSQPAPPPASPRSAPLSPMTHDAFRLPSGWTPLRLAGWAGAAVLVVLILALLVRAVRHHQHRQPVTGRQPVGVLQRGQPTPEPFFD